MNDNNESSKKNKKPPYVAIGLIFGVAFGASIDNLGLGLALGIAIGAGMDSRKSKKDN